MRYGIVMGILFSCNFLLSASKNTILSLCSYVVIFLILYLTYRFTCSFRDHEREKVLSYSQGLSYIILLFFFGAIISSVFKFLYFCFIRPEYLAELLNQSLLLLEDLYSDNEQRDLSRRMIEKMLTPTSLALQYLWLNTLLGLLVGIVLAAFTKKEKSIFETQS